MSKRKLYFITKLIGLIILLLSFALIFNGSTSVNIYGWETSSNERVKDSLVKVVKSFHSISLNGGHASAYSASTYNRFDVVLDPMEENRISWEANISKIGILMIKVFEMTEDQDVKDAINDLSNAMIVTQSINGGWVKQPYFGKIYQEGTMDDGVTQTCVMFLLEAYRAKISGTREIRAMEEGLNFLIESQYENGAWPQAFPLQDNYTSCYTINDDLTPRCIYALWNAYKILDPNDYPDREKYREAAIKGADWLVKSQLPCGGWAQQYDRNGNPAQARFFEPPAVSSLESVYAGNALIFMYRETGDEKYIQPINNAIVWLRENQLPDGKWSRLYDLQEGKPLFVTPEGEVTGSDVYVRPGYTWKGTWGNVIEEWESVLKGDNQIKSHPGRSKDRVEAIIEEIDERGLWLSGDMILSSRLYYNLDALVEYLNSH